MRELAERRAGGARGARCPELEQAVRLALLPKDEADDKSAILEIRAGTGGEEAALFAGDLYRMYQRYAELQGWRFEPLSESDTGLGGLKEAIVAIKGQGVFARLKYEAGVHRVQRVPVTEASGRIHTSAATVAVLPEAEEVDIQIDDKDLRIDVYRSSGAGRAVGQHHRQRGPHHPPADRPRGRSSRTRSRSTRTRPRRSGSCAPASTSASAAERDAERAASRRGQVGSGDRSERIRTYNFPQDRCTDHRINLTLYKLDKVLNGEALDEMIDALTAEDQAALLAEAS